MEVWILRSSKELKKKKKEEGGGERGKHRQSVRRNEMLFAVPVNIKYCAVTKEREDSQRGKRSRLRLVFFSYFLFFLLLLLLLLSLFFSFFSLLFNVCLSLRFRHHDDDTR